MCDKNDSKESKWEYFIASIVFIMIVMFFTTPSCNITKSEKNGQEVWAIGLKACGK